MPELTPFDYSGHSIRTVMIDGEPWFVGADVCRVLGYSNGSRDIQRHVPAGQAQKYRIGTPGDVVPERELMIISEPGLYRLIMRSNVPAAEPFQAWVTEDLLPTLRKTGVYSVMPRSFAEALLLAAEQQFAIEENERAIKERDGRLAIAEPKARIAEFWLESEDSIKIVEWAKKFGMTQSGMYKLLRDENIIFKQQDPQYHKTFIQAPKRGYEDCFEQVQEYIERLGRHVPVLLITPVGQDRLAKKLGLLPDC